MKTEWLCPACGETVEAEIESCWKCGKDNPELAAQLAALDESDLVREAVRDQLSFKKVAAEFGKRPPSRVGAETVIEEYRRGEAPPWLAAVLLGACRDPIGYDVAREILLAAPRSLAEDYAAEAMVKIDGASAFADLLDALRNAPDRKSREAAAYGLESLGRPEAATAILETAFAGKIKPSCAGNVLGRLFPDENMVIELLDSGDKDRVRLATEILETCVPRKLNVPPELVPKGIVQPVPPALASRPSAKLLQAVARVLADPNTTMRPGKRETLDDWLKDKLP